MLARKDINAIWFICRDYMELVESHKETEWDDDLGIITNIWDEYKLKATVPYKGDEIYFDIEANYDELKDRFYDISINEWYVEGKDDYFKGWDALSKNYSFYEMEEAFQEAEDNKHKK